MNLEAKLDNIHSRIIKNTFLQLFTAFTRLLLAVGFIPPSLIKIRNIPFTILPDSDPVGHYFNALYQTGFYYEFIGWAQLIAAILLIFPRTAHIGALMFLPIILNIAVLTNSVGFTGTWVITDLMFLAALYLVFWDYDRLKPILFFNRAEKISPTRFEFLLLPVLGALGGVFLSILIAYMNLGNLHERLLLLFLGLSAGGFVFGLFCSIHHRFMRVGRLEGKSSVV